MPHQNDQLRQELLELIAGDYVVRNELAADGALYGAYHPRMQAVHQHNAARLLEIIEQYGWPGSSLVAEDGAEAAWLIVQHAIGNPDLQRQAWKLLQKAATDGEAPLWQAAMLEDRIRALEGRRQVYGTQFDWDKNGEMSPYPEIENRESVDEQRRAVGLRPLAEEIQRQRAAAAKSNEEPPKDHGERERQMEEWARSVGWRR